MPAYRFSWSAFDTRTCTALTRRMAYAGMAPRIAWADRLEFIEAALTSHSWQDCNPWPKSFRKSS